MAFGSVRFQEGAFGGAIFHATCPHRDELESAGLDLLRQAGIELDERDGLKGTDFQEAIRAADALIVRSGTKITAELLENPGKLRAIVRAGVGVDTIDVAAATRKGIVVMNTPGGNTFSTAEHALSLIMALARNMPAAEPVHSAPAKWQRKKFVGRQLAGKTLGIIGVGRIGREVARRAAGLDMKVLGLDPFLAPDEPAASALKPSPISILCCRDATSSPSTPRSPTRRAISSAPAGSP